MACGNGGAAAASPAVEGSDEELFPTESGRMCVVEALGVIAEPAEAPDNTDKTLVANNAFMIGNASKPINQRRA
jgi:hypothetical protein